jgi:hypothetical protein
MTSQMDILYLNDTGHVLAGFTRAAEPDQIEAGAGAFVGDGLHLRGVTTDQDFLVPAAQIGLLRTGLDASVLRDPRRWFWNLAATPPALVLGSNQSLTATANVAGTTVTIAPGAGSFAAGTIVRMLIEGPSLGSPLQVSVPPIAAGLPSIPIPVPALASDSYYAIVFVPLYPITATQFAVP